MARKVPELCKAYTPGKTDQDVNSRLARLEHIIEMALPQFCSPNSGYRVPYISEGDDDSRSQTSDQDPSDPSGGTFHSGKWYGNSASGSVAPASVLEEVRSKFLSRNPAVNNLNSYRT